MLLRGKEREETERLLRLAVQPPSYVDSLASALRELAISSADEEIHGVFNAMARALGTSHRDAVAFVLSSIANMVVCRRKLVLRVFPQEALLDSYREELLLAPFTGPNLLRWSY